VGLILVTIALLIALSLISFDPVDPSFNLSRNPLFEATPNNLIGMVGSHSSDLLFQFLGYAGFLLPAFLGVYAFQWLASRTVENLLPRLSGMALMILTVAAGLSLFPSLPRIGNQIPTGGGGGKLMADWLGATFNSLGAAVILISLFLVSLLLSTRFSFVRTVESVQSRLGFVVLWRQRLTGWYDAQLKDRVRKRIQKKNEQPTVVVRPARKKAEKVIRSITKRQRKEAAPDEVPIEEMAVTEIVTVPLRSVNFPSPDLLLPPEDQIPIDEEMLRERAELLEAKAREFEVGGKVQQIHPGPVVTTFEFKPEPGIKYSKIAGLGDDLCLALEAESIRIDRLPGKATVGIEVPNQERATITLRELIESPTYLQSNAKLPLALGKDITGKIVVSDLHRMPHLLIAGSTGTGKSVSINSLILSLLFRSRPDQVKMIMIDPKRLELGLYQDIPHLMVPVVTEPIVASNVLKWAVGEMEGRYKKLAKRGVRSLDAYNNHIQQLPIPGIGEPDLEEEREQLPYIVIVIDELADLMMVASRDVEESITRLAQMARAVGIHLILATQRPSVDVITGLIKANFPARISFRVASKTDSRTILDSNGAESLLGRGDMLFLPPGSARLMRAHGPMVTEDEVMRVADYLKAQGKPTYNESILESPEERRGSMKPDGATDELYDKAVRLVVEMGKGSTSALQRRLRIGYGRAASILDAMEADGIIGPPEGSKPREVLVKPDYFEEIDNAKFDTEP